MPNQTRYRLQKGLGGPKICLYVKAMRESYPYQEVNPSYPVHKSFTDSLKCCVYAGQQYTQKFFTQRY